MANRSKNSIAGIFLALSFFLYPVADAWAEDDLSIGRMRVSIWPEHDDPGILVIYDGRFVDDSQFPTKTSFFIPKDAVISDICSLSPEGQHYCQLYEIVKGEGDRDKAVMSLPFSNFYLSFHTLAPNVISEKRDVEFSILANHPIENVEVDIQQPLRSSKFTISPAGGDQNEKKGFNHFIYEMEDIAKGEERLFKISYFKNDSKPSVDIKYGTMAGNRVWGSPYDRQRNAKTLIYIVFGTGIAVAVGGLSWLVVLRRKKKDINYGS